MVEGRGDRDGTAYDQNPQKQLVPSRTAPPPRERRATSPKPGRIESARHQRRQRAFVRGAKIGEGNIKLRTGRVAYSDAKPITTGLSEHPT